jgi:hypothetical protein
MPGANGRTKFKKEKRKRMEIEGVTSTLMQICRQNGIQVTSPQELPEILRGVLAQGAPTMQATGTDGVSLAPDAVHQAPTHLHVTFELGGPPETDWDLEEPGAQPRTAPPQLPEQFDIGPEMMERYEEGQRDMIDRVAREGVRYKNSPNPEVEGRRMSVHPSAAPKPSRRPAPRHNDEPVFDLGSNDLMEPVSDFDLSDPDELSGNDDLAGPNDGRVNAKTGLSLEQQRRIIAKATGQVPVPPEGGMPNTLK